jgi:type 1 glutamine amidotransferase
MRWWLCRGSCAVLLVGLLTLGANLPAADKPSPGVRILLIGKDRDHPFGTHEYMTDCQVLAKCLEQTPGVRATVSNGWPKDEAQWQGVRAVVLYTANGGDVLLRGPQRQQVESLLNQGVGLTAIHWSTGASPEVGEDWLEILGGWFHTKFSKLAVRTTKLQQADPQHPIARGWQPFELRDEYYLHLKFSPKIRPVLTVELDGQKHVVGWVYERNNGGRSFGCVLGHFHANFGEKAFRRLLVNGILWTAHLEVPAEGAPCEVTAQDLQLPPDTRKPKP